MSLAGGGGVALTATQRKLRFVRIALPNERATAKAVPRTRLTVEHLNKLFNADVEFLQEETSGVTIWPDHWVAECLPAPALYVVRERVWPTLEPDALETHAYRGGTRVVVDNVPEDVTAGALTAWLRAGLDDDDPDYSVVKQRHDEAASGLALVRDAIAQLPLEAAGGGAGAPAGGAVPTLSDAAARADRAQGLNAARAALEGAVAAAAEEFERASDERARALAGAFTVRVVDTKLPLRLAVWEVRFARTPAAARMAYVAVHKSNWRDFRLAVLPSTGAAVAGRGDDVRKRAPPGAVEVNMRGVTVTRRRHGRGTFRFDDERGYYAGAWVRGVRDGAGVELNALGRFVGTLRRDWRRGAGRQVFSSGDGYAGAYGCAANHPRESLLFGDEYCDGTPHGVGRAAFVDGSVYEGEWRDGAPAGRGRYVGADGVVAEGDFGEWGALHGHGSETAADVTRIGAWRHGGLHGGGTEIDAALGEFEGTFRHGLRHGRGTQTGGPLPRAALAGWWRHGLRDGRGVLNYDAPPATGGRSGSGDAGGPGAGSLPFEWAATALSAAVAAAAREHGEAPRDPTGTAARRRRRGVVAPTVAAADGNAARGPTAAGAAPSPYAAPEQHFRPYRGDVQAEARWRAGVARGGGLLTLRNGTPVPTEHDLVALLDGRNAAAPGVDALPRVEAELWATRAAARRAAVTSTLRARLAKEADNAASYAYWTRRAAAAFRDVVRRTRRGRFEVDAIRGELTGVTSAGSDSDEDAPDDAAGGGGGGGSGGDDGGADEAADAATEETAATAVAGVAGGTAGQQGKNLTVM